MKANVMAQNFITCNFQVISPQCLAFSRLSKIMRTASCSESDGNVTAKSAIKDKKLGKVWDKFGVPCAIWISSLSNRHFRQYIWVPWFDRDSWYCALGFEPPTTKLVQAQVQASWPIPVQAQVQASWPIPGPHGKIISGHPKHAGFCVSDRFHT